MESRQATDKIAHAKMVAGNLYGAATKPLQSDSNAAHWQSAGLIAFTSATAYTAFFGNWFEVAACLAADAYCAVGLVNNVGKSEAFARIRNAPSNFMSLFKAPAAAPAETEAATDTLAAKSKQM